MRRALSMLLALAGAAAPWASPAAPWASPTAEPPPGLITAAAYLYLPGDNKTPDVPLRIARGARLIFAPADTLGFHSITSVDVDENAAPLFWAEQIGPGQASDVTGVPSLPTGSYLFYCTNHPDMVGTLTVTP